MPKLTIVDRAGVSASFVGDSGLSVMEVIRNKGFDELLAICGGCCSCATCHVYVAEEALAVLPRMSPDEDDLLDSSDHRKPNSRLSCQISLTDDVDHLTVTIAPEE